MTKTTFPCVDLKVESPATVIKQGESRKGVLKFIDEDHFNFTESVIKHIRVRICGGNCSIEPSTDVHT